MVLRLETGFGPPLSLWVHSERRDGLPYMEVKLWHNYDEFRSLVAGTQAHPPNTLSQNFLGISASLTFLVHFPLNPVRKTLGEDVNAVNNRNLPLIAASP
jgi:hypothetical protein